MPFSTQVTDRPHVTGGSQQRRRLTGRPFVRTLRPDDPALQFLHDDGRLPRLWSSGVLAMIGHRVDHGVLGIEPLDAASGWDVEHRDVSDELLAYDEGLDRTQNRQILTALTQLHHDLAAIRPVGMLGLVQWLELLSPCTLAPRRHEVPIVAGAVLPGWSRLLPELDDELLSAVAWAHHEPAHLARRLSLRPRTVIHGNVHFGNLGLSDRRVTLLDWGTTTTVAPAACELAMYVATSAEHVRCTLDEVYEDVAAVVDDERSLRLGFFTAFVRMGWSFEPGTPSLDWWVTKARQALPLL